MTTTAHQIRRSLLLATGVAALCGLVALFAATAHALDDTKPKPTCAGINFTDPAGDAALDLVGIGVGILPVADNMDVTGGFFKYDTDASGTASLTANIEVANLTNDVPTGASGVRWYYFWTVAAQQYFVSSTIDSAGAPTFEYGHTDSILMTDGTTKGKLFPGEKGIIQIAVPQAGTGAKDGAKLTSPYASSRASFDLVAVGFVPTADDGPDSQAGKAYTVAQCPSEATTPSTTPGTTPTTTTQPGALPITLGTSSAKAAKGKKGKSLSFKLKSTEEVTGITATFKKGSTSYGSGKLATLNGSGALKVKLKKALKKGTYKLQLKGSTTAGKGKATFSVKVR